MHFLWLYYIAFFSLLVIGVKKASKGNFFEDYNSLDTMKYIQGWAIVGVILHHMEQKISTFGQHPSVLWPFNDFGATFVGIFFFCSGFGLIYSLKNKPEYLKGFLGNRLPKILVPFYLISWIYLAIYVVQGKTYTSFDFFLTITGLKLVNPDFWFPVCLLLFYILFYLVFKCIKNEKKAFITMFIGIIAYCAFTIYSCHGNGLRWLQGEWWCNSCLLFYVGMLWAKFEKQILHFINKFYRVLVPVVAVLFVLSYKLFLYAIKNWSYWSEMWIKESKGLTRKWGCFGVQTIAILLFVVLILLINRKFQFSNKGLGAVGKVTLEMYLIQRILIESLDSLKVNYLIYILVVEATAFVCAVFIHWISHKIEKLFSTSQKIV